jgi:integrase
MPRSPKLRKKNGYWMTKAGGQEKYFGLAANVTYADARKAYLEHLKRVGQTGSRRHVVTCLEVCDLHLDWVQKNRSDALYKQRKHFLDRWCDFNVAKGGRSALVRDLPYTQISQENLEEWLDHLLAVGELGMTSRSSAQTAVKACWNWAAKDAKGPLPRDFRPFLDMPKIQPPIKELTEDELVTEAEIELLFKWADADLGKVRGENGRYRQRMPKEYRVGKENPYRGFEDLLRVYHHTGARTSELSYIQVRNLLRRTKQVVLGKHKRSNTEAEKTTRRITLNDAAFAIFERHCHGKSSDDYVFTQGNGSPWNKDRLNDRFGKVRTLAKVRKVITIYDFRHLWISEALMAGNDIATVAKMAGTSIRMIEKVYGHFRNEHFVEAQERLDSDRLRRSRKAANEGEA